MATNPAANDAMSKKLIMNALMLRYRALDAKLTAVALNGNRSSARFDADVSALRSRLDETRRHLTRDFAYSEQQLDAIDADVNALAATGDFYRVYQMPVEQRNAFSMPPPPDPTMPLPEPPSAVATDYMTNVIDATGSVEPSRPVNNRFSLPASRKRSVPEESESESGNADFNSWLLDLTNMILALDKMVRSEIPPVEQATQLMNTLITLKQQRDHVARVLPEIDVQIRYLIDNPDFERLLNTYRKYGIVNVSHEPLQEILTRVRSSDAESRQEPSIRHFIRTLTRNINNPVPIKVDRLEFERVTDHDVKMLLYVYRLQSNLRVVNKEQPAVRSKRPRRQARSGSSASSNFITDPTSAESAASPNELVDEKPEERLAETQGVSEILSDLRETPEVAMALTPFEDELNMDELDMNNAPGARQFVETQLLQAETSRTQPLVSALMSVLPPCERLAFCELKQQVDITRYSTEFERVRSFNLSLIDHRVYLYQMLEPLAYYAIDERSVMVIGWFIVSAYIYFTTSVDNFEVTRQALQREGGFSDIDRVALFFIKYNYLFYYRQLISELGESRRYMNQRIVVLLKTYDIIVQKYYNSIDFKFRTPASNTDRPLEPIVLLTVARTA